MGSSFTSEFSHNGEFFQTMNQNVTSKILQALMVSPTMFQATKNFILVVLIGSILYILNRSWSFYMKRIFDICN